MSDLNKIAATPTDGKCQHCGNQQRYIYPWAHVPICKQCRKPMFPEEKAMDVQCNPTRAQLARRLKRLEDALREIRDECDGKIDIDKEGRPNTEARIDSIAAGVL